MMIQFAESFAFKCFINFFHFCGRFSIDGAVITIIFTRSLIYLLLILHLNIITMLHSIGIHFLHTTGFFLYSTVVLRLRIISIMLNNASHYHRMLIITQTIPQAQGLHFLPLQNNTMHFVHIVYSVYVILYNL